MSDTVTLTLQQAEQLSLDILTRNGFSDAHAAAITRSVLAAQRDECHSHGLYRILNCVEAARLNAIDPRAEPEIIDQAPAVVRINAHQGCSLLSMEQGLPLLVKKARTAGIALLGINNCFHFSALWSEVEALSSQGVVGIAMNPTHAFVAPAGGRRPLLGTNPFAFSWPRPGQTPYTFDFATSVVARGEIELHRRAGKQIPDHWAVDADGNPTTSPEEVLAGAMLTFGGHKGSALSTMIELLAGPLIGDLLGHETQAPTAEESGKPFHGELLIAIAPEVLLGDQAAQHLSHAERLFEEIIDQDARLPSQRRYAARERSLVNGVTIPEALYLELKALL